MKCQKCGMEVRDGVKFCPKCGNKFEDKPVASVAPAAEEGTPSVWPEWRIIKQLGRGSFGVVYQAVRRDHNVESTAAIKVISIPSDSSEIDSLRSEGLDYSGTKTFFKGIVDDFVREIQLMESLKGIQNIVSVEDYKVIEKQNEIGWDIYIRMELLTPFNTFLCNKILNEAQVIKLGCDICSALEICGQRNVIHRDIKPENIFINSFGHYKLGDFGIARKLENMTGGLSQKGTFNYMAPEVANSKTYDARVDTYSLGIVLYRLLNGNKLPFISNEKQLLNPNDRKIAVERRLRGEPLPAPCNASAEMADVILRACAFNPANRFANATQMKQALLKVANGTYKISKPLTVDATVPVNKEIAFANNDTVAVNNVPETVQPNGPVVDTFGDKPVDEEKKKKKKKLKAKIIAGTVITLILAVAITLTALFFTSPAYSVYKNMQDGKIDNAVKQYSADVADNFIQETILETLLKNRVDEVVSGYNDGKISYEVAVAELTALETMGFDGAKDKIAEVSAKNDAANALEKAEGFYNSGDLANAIAEYAKVPQGSEDYNTAQSKLNEICPKYIDSVVNTISTYNSGRQYKDAISYADTAYKILPAGVDTSKLDSAKAESLMNYKTEVSKTVNDYIAAEKYQEAFTALDEAIKFTDDQYFKDLKTTTEEDYVKTVIAKADELMKKRSHSAAKKVVSDAIAILPNNSTLSAKLAEIEKSAPVSLASITPINGGWKWNEGTPTDPFGVTHIDISNYAILNGGEWDYSATHYAEYRLQGKYKTISGSMISYKDIPENGKTQVKIYADDKLVYLSPDIGRKTDLVNFSVDVTGVDYIKIEVVSNDGVGSSSSRGCFILMDALLWG